MRLSSLTARASLKSPSCHTKSSSTKVPMGYSDAGFSMIRATNVRRCWRRRTGNQAPAVCLGDEDRSDWHRIPLGPPMRMIPAVSIERVLNCEIPDQAVCPFVAPGLSVARLVLVLCVEPAGPATVGSAVWHGAGVTLDGSGLRPPRIRPRYRPMPGRQALGRTQARSDSPSSHARFREWGLWNVRV